MTRQFLAFRPQSLPPFFATYVTFKYYCVIIGRTQKSCWATLMIITKDPLICYSCKRDRKQTGDYQLTWPKSSIDWYAANRNGFGYEEKPEGNYTDKPLRQNIKIILNCTQINWMIVNSRRIYVCFDPDESTLELSSSCRIAEWYYSVVIPLLLEIKNSSKTLNSEPYPFCQMHATLDGNEISCKKSGIFEIFTVTVIVVCIIATSTVLQQTQLEIWRCIVEMNSYPFARSVRVIVLSCAFEELCNDQLLVRVQCFLVVVAGSDLFKASVDFHWLLKENRIHIKVHKRLLCHAENGLWNRNTRGLNKKLQNLVSVVHVNIRCLHGRQFQRSDCRNTFHFRMVPGKNTPAKFAQLICKSNWEEQLVGGTIFRGLGSCPDGFLE